VVNVQLFNDPFPHGDVVVGPVETHAVDVADQPLTLRYDNACCAYQQKTRIPPAQL